MVIGIYNQNELQLQEIVFYGLYALQHRGQESAGIAVTDGNSISYHKGMGLVAEVFDEQALARLAGGKAAIGHVRYATAGDRMYANAQPLVTKYKKGSMALTHDGRLVNAGCIRKQLEEDGAIFQTNLDIEVIANLIAKNIDPGLEEALKKLMGMVQGAYSLLIMTEDKLIAIRDPLGIRPLALGRLEDSYVIASETCAFDTIGAEYIRDVKPGEIIIIDENGLTSVQTPVPLHSSLCIFEFVYYARTDSTIDGISVYMARKQAGAKLAAEHPVEADLVIGVPDSGTTAAIGYAEASGIPYGEGFIKNRYVGRTFIRSSQHIREQGVRIKLNALRRIVKGKRIVVIDDSIVRGTTSKKIVEMLRLAGAKEVHMRISSPPVRFPCYYGVDIDTSDQLIGHSNDVDEICRIIGADSLGYLSQEGLIKTVEGSGCGFCRGCFNAEYPIEIRHKQ
ncbi:MAG TPA: amidophosphoribosyltransferase [Clostridiales bacterium]|nr:amidophosphoribosyltransferase [Clostridiales bacterium]